MADSTGVLIDTDSGAGSTPRLHDLRIIAEGGTTETNGILLTPGPGGGPVGPVIERVDAVATNSTGTANGINVQACGGSTRLERVNAFGDDNGMQVGATNCLNAILWSQFYGLGNNDVNAAGGASFTLANSHLVTGTNGTLSVSGINCVGVTTPTGTLQNTCAAP